jgi:hypothetical protein
MSENKTCGLCVYRRFSFAVCSLFCRFCRPVRPIFRIIDRSATSACASCSRFVAETTKNGLSPQNSPLFGA